MEVVGDRIGRIRAQYARKAWCEHDANAARVRQRVYRYALLRRRRRVAIDQGGGEPIALRVAPAFGVLIVSAGARAREPPWHVGIRELKPIEFIELVH